jgi:hypothetical protein
LGRVARVSPVDDRIAHVHSTRREERKCFFRFIACLFLIGPSIARLTNQTSAFDTSPETRLAKNPSMVVYG